MRFGDLKSFYDAKQSLRQYIPEKWWNWPCHADPEFYTYTYGDNCDLAPRAVGLKNMQPGDFIFFIVRLMGFAGGQFLKAPGFYLIGYLEIESVLAAITALPSHGDLEWTGNNAHVRRAMADPKLWNSFWVFKGSVNSRRFRRAVPVDRALSSRVFRTADNQQWRWDSHRSELQTIGAYTRSCRCVIDPGQPDGPERADYFWRAITQVEGLTGLPLSVDSPLAPRPPRE